nr:transmembrane 9 superfamily member 2 [Quercus suber]
MARRILNTCYLVLVLVALSTVAFAIVWTQRSAPLSEEDRDDDDEEYKEGDYIPLFANKACPYQGDPCEPYSYFDFPFCPPEDPIPNRKKSFQELLAGDCYFNTQYELRFKMGTTRKLFCEKNLTREEVAKFRDAIANETMYEMYYDNIRLEEQVGVNASDLQFPPIQYQVGLYLINHLDFHILYLGNKQENQDEVSDLSKHDGGDDRVPYATTAFVICIWLGLLCAVIVAYTYLRKYFTWISFGEATGVGRGDACRCPRYSSLLGAILGVGTQQFIMYHCISQCHLEEMQRMVILASILDLLDLREVFISSWHGATVSGGALAIDGGSGKSPLQNSFLV